MGERPIPGMDQVFDKDKWAPALSSAVEVVLRDKRSKPSLDPDKWEQLFGVKQGGWGSLITSLQGLTLNYLRCPSDFATTGIGINPGVTSVPERKLLFQRLVTSGIVWNLSDFDKFISLGSQRRLTEAEIVSNLRRSSSPLPVIRITWDVLTEASKGKTAFYDKPEDLEGVDIGSLTITPQISYRSTKEGIFGYRELGSVTIKEPIFPEAPMTFRMRFGHDRQELMIPADSPLSKPESRINFIELGTRVSDAMTERIRTNL